MRCCPTLLFTRCISFLSFSKSQKPRLCLFFLPSKHSTAFRCCCCCRCCSSKQRAWYDWMSTAKSCNGREFIATKIFALSALKFSCLLNAQILMRESSVSMSYDVINWVFCAWFLHLHTCLPYFVNPTTVCAIALLQLKVECGHLGKILTGWSDLTKDKRTLDNSEGNFAILLCEGCYL